MLKARRYMASEDESDAVLGETPAFDAAIEFVGRTTTVPQSALFVTAEVE